MCVCVCVCVCLVRTKLAIEMFSPSGITVLTPRQWWKELTAHLGGIGLLGKTIGSHGFTCTLNKEKTFRFQICVEEEKTLVTF